MSAEAQRYSIPCKSIRTRIEVKRSRFIATAAYTPDVHLSDCFIAQTRREFADANHNCWARVIGSPGSTSQAGMSDDGEPQGAAGKPMLTALLHADIGDITVIVSRYFGGTKLGKGGMARAYTDALLNVLEHMPRTEKVAYASLHLQVQYPFLDTLERLLHAYEAQIDTRDFGASVLLQLRVPTEYHAELVRRLNDLSAGTARITTIQEDMDTQD